jgi:carbon monoxide dehydrogenase subunit G
MRLEEAMSEINKSATIEASIEKVFDFVDDPEKIPKYVPNVERVEDVKRSDKRIGDSFRVIYKVLGVTFDEKFTVTEYQRPSHTQSNFEGGMNGTFSWTFESEGPSTMANVSVEYELAGGPLGKAIDALVLERANEKTIERMLQNMRQAIAQQAVSMG